METGGLLELAGQYSQTGKLQVQFSPALTVL